MKVDVRRIGNDFHVIPAGSRITRDGKIDFTWKQYMLKPSFAALVGVARTGDPSEELLAARVAMQLTKSVPQFMTQLGLKLGHELGHSLIH